MDRTVNTRIRTLLRRDEGASAVEYSFLVAAVAAIIVVVVFAIGTRTAGTYQTTCDNWNTAAGVGGTC